MLLYRNKNMTINNEQEKKGTSWIKGVLSFLEILAISLIIIIPIKYFVAEPFLVSGISMQPNFHTADYLIINKFTKYSTIHRGEILVFVPPHERSDSWWKYSVYFDPRKKYIKRVIGLPGETVKLEDHKIYIKRKNSNAFEELKEDYINNNGTTNKTTTLQDDEYYVLGDNRAHSYDSEEWGPIKKSDIVGEPILRLLPFNKISLFPANRNLE